VIARLLCEGMSGSLDARLLTALIAPGGPRVAPAGSKTALGAAAAALTQAKVPTRVMRDRDFDFEPGPDGTQPVEWTWSGEPVGWHWRRHEVENYLLDPALVERALGGRPGFARADYEARMVRCAEGMRPWMATRWTLGSIRRDLPRRLGYRPEGLDLDADEDTCREVGLKRVARFAADSTSPCAASSFESRCDVYFLKLGACTTAGDVLRWYAGKDLLAGIQRLEDGPAWCPPGSLVDATLETVAAAPEECCALLPEFVGLRALAGT